MEFQLSYFILKDDVVKVLCSCMPANLENSAVATGLENVSFHPNPKERQIHIVKSFSIVHEAEVDFLGEFSHFIYDPMDVGSLISGSSAFSKSSFNIWKFSVHVLLKPDLQNFEHYFVSMCDECNCVAV